MASQLPLGAVTSSRSWSGHLPETRRALLGLLVRATREAARFGLEERAFVTAAECWASIAGHEVGRFLRRDPAGQLRRAGEAFALLQMPEVAAILRAAAGAYADPVVARRPRRLRSSVERLLQDLSPTIDEQLAACARRLPTRSPPLH